MRCRFIFGSLLFICVCVNTSFAQTDILNTEINIEDGTIFQTKKDVLTYLSDKYHIIFSYNANLLEDNGIVVLKNERLSLKELLNEMFSDDQLLIITVIPNKIILQSKGPKLKVISVSGKVYDRDSGESIYGAVIYENHSNVSVLSNEKGYFTITLPKGKANIEVRYLGYKSSTITIDLDKPVKFDIPMVSDNLLDTIIIDDPMMRIQLIDGGNIIDVFKSRELRSIIGEKDMINNVRVIPGVQSGGEGQSGLYVRGGTPDQNLILLDGVALYETSHIGGISSIFMEESIKEASFVRNGFPARYGGRLSGVLDIQLKEGNRYTHKTEISAGLAGSKIHLEGPVFSDKTTYSITARTSWLNFYVNSLLRKFTKYDNINLSYSDILGKFTHRFSPSNSISLTIYQGSDRLQLTKENTFEDADYQLNVFDRNGLDWGNSMATLKWNVLLSDKLSFKVQSGALRYKNGSRSSYKFETIAADSIKTDELDVITKSNITDFNIKSDLEYYLDDHHVLRAGANTIIQQFNPTIKQSTFIIAGNADNIIDKDSLINARQYQFYVEDNYKINTTLFLYTGFHYARFIQGKTQYGSLQPRLKLLWTPIPKHIFSGAFSRMTQYVHLLSNSGLGLPSDLWVPSTSLIKPQHSDQFSLSYTWNTGKGAYIYLGGYQRKFTNSLEYTSPVELFYFLINDQNIVPVYNTSRDWERNLLVGSATSKGLEFLVHKTEGNTKGWSSVTWSKTERKFALLNKGLPFPANHDKTWNINMGLSQKLSTAFSAGINFVYTTGNTFSLATEEYDSALGITLLRADGRNNYRLPPFHHVSLNADYLIKGKKFDTMLNLNLYNIYNRLNAYFIYIYENPAPPYNRYLKKVSILPFTPSLTVSIKF